MESLQHFINALSLGSVYATIAVGYTMVFGVLRLVNFAHGEMMMMGAYFGYLCMRFAHMDLWASVLVAMVLCSLSGLAVEKFVYRKIEDKDYMMIAAMGVSLILQYVFLLIFGAQPHVLPKNPLTNVLIIDGIHISVAKLAAIVFVLVSLAVLYFILHKTKIGVAVRALASNSKAAQLCGINPAHPTRFIFVMGSALAGIAGILYGSVFSLNPLMGMTIGLKAFAAAVVGGIGSIAGAVLGAFLMAFAETLCAIFIGSAYKNAVAFIILMVVLIFFPSGIFPKSHRADRV